jgi:hypothetical protein
MAEQYDLFDPFDTLRAGRYPYVPGHKSCDDTTMAAAIDMTPHAGTLRHAVLHQLKTNGPMTADECAAALDESPLAIRPRFSELRLLGLVHDSASRRPNSSGKTAIVWTP